MKEGKNIKRYQKLVREKWNIYIYIYIYIYIIYIYIYIYKMLKNERKKESIKNLKSRENISG